MRDERYAQRLPGHIRKLLLPVITHQVHRYQPRRPIEGNIPKVDQSNARQNTPTTKLESRTLLPLPEQGPAKKRTKELSFGKVEIKPLVWPTLSG
ncbi:MAG: hypothetical protein Q9169_003081 [Polycauliona sp. 2 TL-2023]